MMYKEAKEMNQQLLAWRRQIHQHPELGCRLPQTTALVKKALDDMGISWEEIGPCAIVGVIGKKEGKKILLRADMDALPMGEETGLPFASECDGVMHSCGHDCHTSMLLTAAALLKKHEEELQGQVILMFQPDEEGTDGTGARMMVENGLLDKYKPDVAVMAHMASDIVKTNQIMLKSGPCSASSDRFVVHLHGKGGHGARPHQSINPITCAIKIAEAFGDIGRYEVDVQEPTALSICTFHSGTASNIIPEDCEFTGTLRTFNDEARQFTLDRMQQVAQSIADAYRCQLPLTVPGAFLPSSTIRSSASSCTPGSRRPSARKEWTFLPCPTPRAWAARTSPLSAPGCPPAPSLWAAPATRNRSIPCTIPRLSSTRTVWPPAPLPMPRPLTAI